MARLGTVSLFAVLFIGACGTSDPSTNNPKPTPDMGSTPDASMDASADASMDASMDAEADTDGAQDVGIDVVDDPCRGRSCVPFVTTWKTDNIGEGSNTQVTIGRSGEDVVYDFDVDWDNDGVYDELGLSRSVTHDYGTPGEYTIAIRGTYPSLNLCDFGQLQYKLLRVEQWGDSRWQSMEKMFSGCVNVEIVATDAPDLSQTTSIRRMFAQTPGPWGTIASWDTSNIQNMAGVFVGARTFNEDISGWDTSNVTDMSFMFQEAAAFNQPIGVWNTSKVTDMRYMFAGTAAIDGTAFNQDISGWDTSSVTTMKGMFQLATSFNQDLSSWDTSKVTDMSFMFENSEGMTYGLGQWDISSVTTMQNMFYQQVGLSLDAYDATLIGWEAQANTPRDVFFSNQSYRRYCAALSARESLINNYGWTIGGDVLDCP
ncbi:MAG: BspA family leucine-rich repeat surface protein [bacterium]